MTEKAERQRGGADDSETEPAVEAFSHPGNGRESVGQSPMREHGRLGGSLLDASLCNSAIPDAADDRAGSGQGRVLTWLLGDPLLADVLARMVR